jgi:hypothetical protein
MRRTVNLDGGGDGDGAGRGDTATTAAASGRAGPEGAQTVIAAARPRPSDIRAARAGAEVETRCSWSGVWPSCECP